MMETIEIGGKGALGKQERSMMLSCTGPQDPLDYPRVPRTMADGQPYDEYLIPDEDKRKVLEKLYLFDDVPGMDEVFLDLHSAKKFKVSEFKVVRQDGGNFIVSPFYEQYGGTLLDWAPESSVEKVKKTENKIVCIANSFKKDEKSDDGKTSIALVAGSMDKKDQAAPSGKDETLVDCVEKRFEGDILITDPCYLRDDMEDEQKAEDYWDYFCCDSFDKFRVDCAGLFKFGLTNTLIGRTIYGDWSCTAYRKYEGRDYDIGNFCADAGLVGVFLLEEVKKFNPNFIEWLVKHQWCGTVIAGFDGTVKAITTRHAAKDNEHDIPLLTHTVHLEGYGRTRYSNEFEFYTKQTGY